ncbi:hypothetical protein DH2020_045167 [Rehmannia glutinosa]|uniref:3'-5' exonuclease domain-containing protein n=1 Tax=Rehmannia glutinosa TaxID=99300 RepID=A0ABR0UEU9_REHGL
MYRSRGSPISSPSTITFNPTLSKYYVTFAGTTIETTVTDKSATASEWVEYITATYGVGSPAVVGLDVEWRPHPVQSMSNKSATLQLCIDNKAFNEPNFTFVGIEVGDDVLKLKNEYGLDCSSHVDVRAASKDLWARKYRRPGLKELARELCGLYMVKPKHVCMSNWEARELSEAQVEYACIDAFASYKLGHKLLIEK